MDGFFFFDVAYYDDGNVDRDRGILYADDFRDAYDRIERYFGKDIEDIHIWLVNIDTNEFLFERNFPGLMDFFCPPIE